MYLSLQLYSTVTLRQGEKKHYNNKVDVYSFGIVLWELLTNRMPFEGMSNLQAAYAAAFKVKKNLIWFFFSMLLVIMLCLLSYSFWMPHFRCQYNFIKCRPIINHASVHFCNFRSVLWGASLKFLCIVRVLKSTFFLFTLYYCQSEMQQERPSLPEDISPDLAFIIQSCWVEDSNLRPSFSQIIRMLNEFLFTLSPPSPPLPESDTKAVATSNGTMTEFSTRARGKFAFLRQLFTAKRTKNSQWTGKFLKKISFFFFFFPCPKKIVMQQ